MSFVAVAFAAVMLVRYKSSVDKFYRAMDWDLLGFFAALFVVINVMEHALVLDLIGKGFTKVISLTAFIGHGAGTGAILVSSAAFSSVTDNIPLSAMLAKVLQAQGTASTDPLWWSVVFGANLGGKRRDLRLLLICLGALVGRPFEALLLTGAISHACVIGILITGWRVNGPAGSGRAA